MIHLKGLSQEQVHALVPDNTILLGYRGSIAHGTYTPPHSDKDLLGVMIPPIQHYFGLTQFDHYEKTLQGSDGTTWESVIYELRKYVQLLLKSNPNVLSLLWLPDHLYIYKTKAGQTLIDNRDIFVSKQIYHSFTGYAHGQLHRMLHTNTSNIGAKRKAQVKKFGFDPKNAAHLIRLLRMGIEFLTDGELHVVRQDAPELLDIKNGYWPKDKIISEADRLFALAQQAYIKSPLPPKPDKTKAEKLLVDILRAWYDEERRERAAE